MKQPVGPLRVMLADDHTLVRAGIHALLEKVPGVNVIAEASDGREVLNLCKSHHPDVILMDIGMSGLNGLDATARLAQEFPGVRVIILSMHQNEEYVWRAFKAGAAGYLLKKAATAELATALQRVAQGEFYLSREISRRLHKGFARDGIAGWTSPLEQLTSRQREILQLIAEGLTVKQIGDMLQVSPKTVEYHRTKLMDCLGLHDIPALVRFALRMGLVSHDG